MISPQDDYQRRFLTIGRMLSSSFPAIQASRSAVVKDRLWVDRELALLVVDHRNRARSSQNPESPGPSIDNVRHALTLILEDENSNSGELESVGIRAAREYGLGDIANEVIALRAGQDLESSPEFQSAVRRIANLLGPPTRRPTQRQIQDEIHRRAIKESVILAEPIDSIIVFFPPGSPIAPRFQFVDEAARIPRKVIQEVDIYLNHKDDSFGSYLWWSQPNAWIGAAPRSMLGTPNERSIVYAAEQLQNDDW